jgi:hypothetical protein
MRNLLIILFLGLCITSVAKDKKKKILIEFIINNNNCKNGSVDGEVSLLKSDLAEILEKELPCFDILFRSDIQALLGNQRDRALLGNPDDAAVEEMLRQFANFDYIMVFNLSCFNDKVTISGSKFSSRNVAKVENKYTQTGTNDNVEFIDNYAKAFIDDLMYSEPCPYKGTLKIDDLATETHDSISDRSIICSNLASTHGTEKFVLKEKREVIRKIELNKIKKLAAEGSYTSSMNYDKYSKYVNDDCYICSMDGTDATIKTTGDYSDEITEKSQWHISGIASYKNDSDNSIKDSEVALHFDKNGTYTVEVKAVSDYGQFEASRTEKTNSTCAGQNTKKDDPVSYKVNDIFKFALGPFKGTPFDKELKESGTMNSGKTNSKEKHTITYEFNFSR